MPIVAMPISILERLTLRIDALKTQMDVRVFAADEVVPGLLFSAREISEFGTDGRSMILAVSDFDKLADLIPQVEDGKRNYIHLTHPRAVLRLDPFASKRKK